LQYVLAEQDKLLRVELQSFLARVGCFLATVGRAPSPTSPRPSPICENIIKLNPKKYVFGVSASKLLGFIFSNQGIKFNPNKIVDIFNITRFTYLKDIQQLTNCVDVVSRFVSLLGEKVMSLY
jgi:hypothetical protein